MAELLFLGTGGSMGVPVIGCRCSVCLSDSPLNKRLRPSALLRINNQQILIDASPDLRTQALDHRLDRMDGVILTHAHHDHTAGIDDFRVYNMHSGQALPCLASQATYDDLLVRYEYIFKAKKKANKLVANVDIQLLEGERGETVFLGNTIRYVTYIQAQMPVNGICLGNLAYISDIREYSDSIFEDLKGTEVLVLSALRYTPSPMHFSIDEAVEFSQKVGAKETWLTHIAHEVDHEKVNAQLPENIRLAYDGLTINFLI